MTIVAILHYKLCNMKAHLYIIRGVPGSGKSTRAKQIAKENKIKYFEADQFFEQSGKYEFDPAKLSDAHAWCKQMIESELKSGNSVIVSNTFTRKWEYVPYEIMAVKYGASSSVEIMSGGFDNVHGVPKKKVEEMIKRFEY